jgi:predicted sulfurtransferase
MRPPDSDSSSGSSDPVTYTCTCDSSPSHISSSSSSAPGSVLLFYRYWAAEPALPDALAHLIPNVDALAAWYTQQTSSLHLGGKIRIAREGFNVTVAGSAGEISTFISACVAHWSFAGLGLGTATTSTEHELEAQQRYFKPSPGCSCVFSRKANVRVVAEATPMGVEGYAPADWSKVVALPPAEFHAKCYEKEKQSVLVDVRNHYESRIGYFVSPLTGEPALKPPIRRFSQWPQYIKGHLEELKEDMGGKQILTYCTGGIRCEKGVRWMQERLGESETVFTLKGGIAAYLEWMNEEMRKGRKTAEDSLFKGKNYVFDARGAMGLEEGEAPVSKCLLCDQLSSRLDKCHSDGCHLVLVVCENCQDLDPRCCQDCRDMDASHSSTERVGKAVPRPMCACEKEREAQLWAGDRSKEPKTQGWKKRKEEGKVWKKVEKTAEERDASNDWPREEIVDVATALAQLQIVQNTRKADKVDAVSEHAQLAIEKYVPGKDAKFDGDVVRRKIADLDNGIWRTQKLYDMLVSADIMLQELRTTDPELARLVGLTFGGPAIFELKLERQKAKDKIEVLLQKLIENSDGLEDETMPQQLSLEFGS